MGYLSQKTVPLTFYLFRFDLARRRTWTWPWTRWPTSWLRPSRRTTHHSTRGQSCFFISSAPVLRDILIRIWILGSVPYTGLRIPLRILFLAVAFKQAHHTPLNQRSVFFALYPVLQFSVTFWYGSGSLDLYTGLQICLRLRILLFLAVAFKMPTKNKIFSSKKLAQSKQAHHTPLNQRSVFFIISCVLVPWHPDPDPRICTLDYESVFVSGSFSFWQWLSRCQQKIRFFLANKLTQSKQAHHTPLNQRSVFFIIISSVPVPWHFDTDPDLDPWICILDYGFGSFSSWQWLSRWQWKKKFCLFLL